MINHFNIVNLAIPPLKLIERIPFDDQRGYFERIFCKDILKEIIQEKNIVQINHTYTKYRGTVRGLHYQLLPFAEIKLVSCLQGEVYDVAIDLRVGSPTFLHHYAEVLTASNYKMLLIPEGFAHGFQTLTNDCEMLYLHTNYYSAEFERGINALDSRLNIRWPLPITNRSSKDIAYAMVSKNFKGITI